MPYESSIHSQPLELNSSTESQTYLLFATAIALTVVGVHFGSIYAPLVYGAGLHFVLLLAQLGIVFTAGMWVNKTPLNYILFGIFPIFSGFAIAPFISAVMTGYSNGPSIVMNALSATVFMAGAAAVFARSTSMDLSWMGRMLLFSVFGLIGFSLLQWFVPSLRASTTFELMLSGAGVVVFALFTAYDVQRIQRMSQYGVSPFLLALSLYLDIYNLFLYILRFMLVLYGDRR